MQYTNEFTSPLGKIFMAADEIGLTGLWLEGQKYFARGLDKNCKKCELPVFAETKRWLKIYFSARKVDFTPPLHLIGTQFQMRVWKILQKIPYGKTTTYGQIAKQIATPRGKMSAQAVGGAVGHNPISIIVPCHRVVGADGSLTGYAGGIERKAALLKLEGAIFN